MSQAIIGCGANLGDPQATLDQVVAQLQVHPQIESVQASPWLETSPVGGPSDQPSYWNGVLSVETTLSPMQLLHELQALEQAAGRKREQHWGARTLDLDLLLYDDVILNTAELQLPHPWIPFRQFVLDPAVLVAPQAKHPILRKSFYELRQHLLSLPYWFVIQAPTQSLANDFAQRLGSEFAAQVIQPLQQQDLPEISLRDLPPREVYLSSVDWTSRSGANISPLQLEMTTKSQSRRTFQLAAGRLPLPKARLVLVADQAATLQPTWSQELLPLYQELSPIPTLLIDLSAADLAWEAACTMLRACIPVA
jgi:2-amino-4-hydroxy-6-hydroxymethyldihydropteridine diphosphokinase